MIFIDLSQVVLSTIFTQIVPGSEINQDIIRHMTFNCIRSYRKKFSEYGRLVVCVDNKVYWRKQIFPYYKSRRKKDREKSKFDWPMIYETLDQIKADLTDFFPYQVLDVPGSEADDIIGVLCKKYNPSKSVILSRDKDMIQLQKYPNVVQFSPIEAKWIKIEDPVKYLKSHIMKGDEGDGIPNFLSADDTFVKDGARQKPIRKDKLELWSTLEPERFCTSQMLRGYKRNEGLIDFEKIPPNIQMDIIQASEVPFHPDRSKMFEYFRTHKMRQLMECINEF